jgi:hypothetical protein
MSMMKQETEKKLNVSIFIVMAEVEEEKNFSFFA